MSESSRRRVQQLRALGCVLTMSSVTSSPGEGRGGLLIISPDDLVKQMGRAREKLVAIDTRGLAQFNVSHICDAVNIGSNKLLKRRLQQDKVGVEDLLGERAKIGRDGGVAVAYNESGGADGDEFMSILMDKLRSLFQSVFILEGGYRAFLSHAPHLCTQNAGGTRCLPAFSAHSVPTELPVTEILPFLYLGCERDAQCWETLAGRDIGYVMNVTDRCENRFPDQVKYLRVSVRDSGTENIRVHFQQAIDFIDGVRLGNGRVLVHCFAGISRSATMAIAYIMKYKKWSLDESYRFVKSKRPNISPNLNFMGQLLEFEKTCSQPPLDRNVCPWRGLPGGSSGNSSNGGSGSGTASPTPMARYFYSASPSMDGSDSSTSSSSSSGTAAAAAAAADRHAPVLSYAS